MTVNDTFTCEGENMVFLTIESGPVSATSCVTTVAV